MSEFEVVSRPAPSIRAMLELKHPGGDEGSVIFIPPMGYGEMSAGSSIAR